MTKSKILDDLYSNTDHESFNNKRKQYYENLSFDYQTGRLVGDIISMRDLRTLNIDGLNAAKVIKVSDEEMNEYKKIENEWSKSSFDNLYHPKKDSNEHKELWNKLSDTSRALHKKYLPETIDCYFSFLRITDMFEFKKGVGDSMWECDYSNYDCNAENIEVILDNDGFLFTKIILKLSID